MLSNDTNPTSKADLVDRILSQDFSGDFREIAKGPVKITRPKPHVVSLKIGDKEFLLAVHKPKSEAARLAAKQRWANRGKQRQQEAQQPTNRKGTTGRYS